MRITATLGILSLFVLACQKPDYTVKHASSMSATTDLLGKVQVVNPLDPICEMSTAEHLYDTVQYKNKVYGFCSSGCKEEFKKSPEKYVQK